MKRTLRAFSHGNLRCTNLGNKATLRHGYADVAIHCRCRIVWQWRHYGIGCVDMAKFESSHDYLRFAQFVKQTARYVLDAGRQHFIDVLLETSLKRRIRLSKGSVLWRAQLGHECRTEGIEGIEYDKSNGIEFLEMPHPLLPKRMRPRRNRACEGRVNPKGIPCLYLSTERETAMTEVRPWIGSYVSVAQFVIPKDLSLVDCVSDTKIPNIYPIDSKGPDKDERENDVWWFVNQAFLEPVTRADDVADYAPTQMLAEAFRHGGFDGIRYGSKLGNGMTVAVFDMTAAELTSCDLYLLEAFNPRFSKAAYSYRVAKSALGSKPTKE